MTVYRDGILPGFRPTREAIRALLADGCQWSARELAEVGKWNLGAVYRTLGWMARDSSVQMCGVTGWRISQSLLEQAAK